MTVSAARSCIADFHPVPKEYPGFDIVVCGGGPSGIGAAVAAGRLGARVLLLERLFYVGGIGATTSVTTWGDAPGGPVFDELEQRIAALGKARRRYDPNSHTCPIGRVFLQGETLKAVALRMLHEAGVQVMFGAVACGASVAGGRITGVFAARKDGLLHIPAAVVVDTSADGDIAAAAGAPFLKGDPDDGRLMHVNFRFQMEGVDDDKAKAGKPETPVLLDLLRQAHAAGRLHAPKGAFKPAAALFPFNDKHQALQFTSWEIEGVDCSDPDAVSATVADCQLCALELIEFCRAHLPGYENCGIARFWDVLGTRESRRIQGLATLTGEDVVAARKRDDGVVKAAFFIDFHDSPPGPSIPYSQEFRLAHAPPSGDWYEIPYGCLLPEKPAGLLVAGRCISATREGLASMRVQPTCMFTGQAAGTAAALAVKKGVAPAAVPVAEIRRLVGM